MMRAFRTDQAPTPDWWFVEDRQQIVVSESTQ